MSNIITPPTATFQVIGSQTDAEIVTAISGSRIRVLSYAVSAVLATSVVFNSKPVGAGSSISHVLRIAANGNFGESSKEGLFETSTGQGLSVTTGAATVDGRVTYVTYVP